MLRIPCRGVVRALFSESHTLERGPGGRRLNGVQNVRGPTMRTNDPFQREKRQSDCIRRSMHRTPTKETPDPKRCIVKQYGPTAEVKRAWGNVTAIADACVLRLQFS